MLKCGVNWAQLLNIYIPVWYNDFYANEIHHVQKSIFLVLNIVNRPTVNVISVRPGSDAVLHMNRIEFNELSSCEVQRLNQFETADIIRIGLAVLHAWLSQE